MELWSNSPWSQGRWIRTFKGWAGETEPGTDSRRTLPRLFRMPEISLTCLLRGRHVARFADKTVDVGFPTSPDSVSEMGVACTGSAPRNGGLDSKSSFAVPCSTPITKHRLVAFPNHNPEHQQQLEPMRNSACLGFAVAVALSQTYTPA